MFFILAPMDWFTDSAYRIITKQIFDKYNQKDEFLMVSEFMSADGYVHNPKWVVKHLLKTQIENPLIAQIFWAWEKNLINTAKDIQNKYDFYGIELNIWCPSPKIMHCGWWSAMLNDKDKTLEIIKNLRKTVKTNFSIKTRIWKNQEDKQQQFDFIIKASKYCDMISLHGRTLTQWHSWDVDREYIYEIKSNAKCKIVGNWWIHSYQDAQDKLWNLDWIMIWQASIWNPWIFTEYKPNIKELYETIIKHLNYMCANEIYFKQNPFDKDKLIMPKIEELESIFKDISKHSQELRSPVEFRKHLFCYVKSLTWSKPFKQDLIKVKDYKILCDKIENFFNKTKDES